MWTLRYEYEAHDDHPIRWSKNYKSKEKAEKATMRKLLVEEYVNRYNKKPKASWSNDDIDEKIADHINEQGARCDEFEVSVTELSFSDSDSD